MIFGSISNAEQRNTRSLTRGTFYKKNKIQVEDESGLGLPPASGDAGGNASGESKERPKECHRPVEEVAYTPLFQGFEEHVSGMSWPRHWHAAAQQACCLFESVCCGRPDVGTAMRRRIGRL